MARPWRIEFAGACYHVMSRGNDRRPVFVDDADRDRFLAYLGRGVERYDFEVMAFCLLSNHFHLLLRTPRGNLSRAMQWLLGSYTQYFNRRHSREGHLFRGRFKAVLVDNDSHWLHLTAYIHLNPVRARLVEDPAQWAWSSFRDYVGARRRFAWVQPEAALAGYGPTAEARRRNYRRAVLALQGAKPSFWRELREAVFVGAPERWEYLREKYPPRGPAAVPEHRLALEKRPDFETELSRVASMFGTQAKALRAGARGGGARPAAYYHLVMNGGFTGALVAERLGVSAMSVSRGVTRARAMMEKDREFHRRMEKLKVIG